MHTFCVQFVINRIGGSTHVQQFDTLVTNRAEGDSLFKQRICCRRARNLSQKCQQATWFHFLDRNMSKRKGPDAGNPNSEFVDFLMGSNKYFINLIVTSPAPIIGYSLILRLFRITLFGIVDHKANCTSTVLSSQMLHKCRSLLNLPPRCSHLEEYPSKIKEIKSHKSF